nr:MAG TPA: hypothetical protein [Caudoviricetes sp.]
MHACCLRMNVKEYILILQINTVITYSQISPIRLYQRSLRTVRYKEEKDVI